MRWLLEVGWWLVTILAFHEVPCRVRRCGRPRGGFAVYCRRHADEILEGRRP